MVGSSHRMLLIVILSLDSHWQVLVGRTCTPFSTCYVIVRTQIQTQNLTLSIEHLAPNYYYLAVCLFRLLISPYVPNYVPVVPITFEWESKSWQQVPLQLRYAVTIHKSQGQTLHKAVFDLGKSELSPGSTFVAVSCLRKLADVISMHELLTNQLLRTVQFWDSSNTLASVCNTNTSAVLGLQIKQTHFSWGWEISLVPRLISSFRAREERAW